MTIIDKVNIEECKIQEKWIAAIARDPDASDYYLYKYVMLLKETRLEDYRKLMGRYSV